MGTITDNKHEAMTILSGLVGKTTNDMEYTWLKTVATGETIPDLWKDYFNLQGCTGPISDQWICFLYGKGYTGSRPDMEDRLWQEIIDGGIIPGVGGFVSTPITGVEDNG